MLFKNLYSFIKRIFFNRTAQFFVGTQWILLVLAIVSRYNNLGTLSGFTGHIYHEPILVSILAIINLPALFLMLIVLFLLMGILSLLFGLLSLVSAQCCFNDLFSNIRDEYTAIPFVIIFLLCVSFQWALIGYGVDQLFKRKSK